MGIRGVIFDLGGVLVRTEDFVPRQELAARFGMTFHELEELVFYAESGEKAQLGEITVEQHWENVRKALSIPLAEFPTFQKDFWNGDRLDEDLIAYIRLLRGNYRTALLSNAFSNLRTVITERWRFADAFDTMVISAEEGMMKPDPRIFHLALNRLKLAPAETVFIDDNLLNVEAANAIGLHAIRFIDPHQSRSELERLLNSH